MPPLFEFAALAARGEPHRPRVRGRLAMQSGARAAPQMNCRSLQQLVHVDAGLECPIRPACTARLRWQHCRVAPGAYGQPPKPATELSNVATPISSDAKMFASSLAVGIVEMTGQLLDRNASRDRLDHAPGLARRADADRVAQPRLRSSPSVTAARDMSATTTGSTSPSNGQPSTTEI